MDRGFLSELSACGYLLMTIWYVWEKQTELFNCSTWFESVCKY